MDDNFAALSVDEIDAASSHALPAEKADDGSTCVYPVPSDAPPPPESHPSLGVPSARWPYHDAEGRVLFMVCRFDKRDGGKEILPLCLRSDKYGQMSWKWKGFPAPRPLFNLDKLSAKPDASVVVVEGEKTANFAERIFPNNVVTTSPSGSKSAGKADWSALAGRRVLIWADADDAGAKYARDVAEILTDIGCDVSTVDGIDAGKISPDGGTRDLPKEGWDAADAVEDWSDLMALRTTIVGLRKPFKRGPTFISFGEFSMSSRGLMAKTPPQGKTSQAGEVWVCAPFEVIGEARDPHGKGWAKVLCWKDDDGREHTVHVPVAAIHREPSALAAMLGADGLKIDRSRHTILASYLNSVSVKRRVTMVGRTGWHRIGDHDVFVLPDETIGPRGSEIVRLDGAALGPYETRGSFTDWQQGVAKLAADHALAVLAISSALVGPLLHLAGQEGGGLNFFGPSSKGKSTLLQIAASVWGRGGSPGYVRAWRATANGLEGAAASASDTLLVLDELGVVEARDAASAIYGLANGSGKARATRNGDLREPKTWRVFTLSSGELPIERKLNEDRGRRAMAGQLVRMLDIPADRGLGFGAFDHGGPSGDAAGISKSMKSAAITSYGTAGAEFIRRISREGVSGENVRTLVADVVGSLVPPRSDGQIDRAAQRLALIAVAGEIGISLGILPWKAGSPTASARWAFARWIEDRGGIAPKEESQAVEQVRLIIEQFGESRFERLDNEKLDGSNPPPQRVLNRLGWTTGNGESREWLVPPAVWRTEICSGLDPRFVAKALGARGMLKAPKDGWSNVRRVQGRNTRVFVILPSIFEGEA